MYGGGLFNVATTDNQTFFLFSLRENQDTYMFSICEEKTVNVEEAIERCPPPKTDKQILDELRMAYALQPRGLRVMGLVPI